MGVNEMSNNQASTSSSSSKRPIRPTDDDSPPSLAEPASKRQRQGSDIRGSNSGHLVTKWPEFDPRILELITESNVMALHSKKWYGKVFANRKWRDLIDGTAEPWTYPESDKVRAPSEFIKGELKARPDKGPRLKSKRLIVMNTVLHGNPELVSRNWFICVYLHCDFFMFPACGFCSFFLQP